MKKVTEKVTWECKKCGKHCSDYASQRKTNNGGQFCSRSCSAGITMLGNKINLGRKQPMEERLRRTKLMAGEKCHKWKGGVTPINEKIRKSTLYKIWRTSVFDRDDYTCQICEEKGVTLNADHIKPFSLFPDLRFELSNGRTLCVPCHRNTETYGGRINITVV